MNDWIEKLRERPEEMNSMKFALENEDPRAAMIRAELWSLLCDVVEAAEKDSVKARSVKRALAALKAEVELKQDPSRRLEDRWPV